MVLFGHLYAPPFQVYIVLSKLLHLNITLCGLMRKHNQSFHPPPNAQKVPSRLYASAVIKKPKHCYLSAAPLPLIPKPKSWTD